MTKANIKVSREQREFVLGQFDKALSEKLEKLIPKTMREYEAHTVITVPVKVNYFLKGGYSSRYGISGYEIAAHINGELPIPANDVHIKSMAAMAKKANHIQDEAGKIRYKLESDLILGGGDLQEVLTEALAQVARL